MLSTLIGHVTVTEPFETTQHYQYAAYYTVHRVQPGTYPVRLLSYYPEIAGQEPWPGYITVRYDTEIVGDYDPARIGKTTTREVQPYAYQAPASLADDGAEAVDWLGGRFTPESGVTFAARWASDGRRYGTAPIVTRADLSEDQRATLTRRDETLPRR